MNSKIITNLPEEKYHSQEGEKIPLFSYSIAKTILDKSPYHAYLEHPLLGGLSNFKTSKAMDTGNLFHTLILGDGAEIVVIDADSYRTKDAKEERDKAYMDKKTPVLAHEYERIQKAIEFVKEQIHDSAPEFFEAEHEVEVSAKWEMNNGVLCQSRWDWLSPSTALQIDLKTTTDASPEKCQRKITDFFYDVQQSMYTMAANQIWPELAGRWKWLWVFVESEPPYSVSVLEPDASLEWLGEQRSFRASEKWKECLESGKWPSYGKQIIGAPPWMTKKEMEIFD